MKAQNSVPRNKTASTIKIQGIEKRPLLLSLLKKIELKPLDNRGGQYTNRVTDLKIRVDMTSANDSRTPRSFYHRTNK
jgi:hypothetical protein